MITTNTVVALHEAHERANHAINELQVAGIEAHALSIALADEHLDEEAVAHFNTGDPTQRGSIVGAFAGGFWGLLFGWVLFAMWSIGTTFATGQLGSWNIAILVAGLTVGAVSAVATAIDLAFRIRTL
jgi:hypothetical protein